MTRIIILAFAVVAAFALIPAALSRVLPAQWWFDVGPVHVESGAAGTPPVVVPTRTINRDFLGTWSANVYRNQGGVFRLHCHREAPEPFWYRVPQASPSAAPADEGVPPIDMDWWLEIPPNPPCTWPVGEYRMLTRWEIHFLGGYVRIPIERNSNVFNLTDPASGDLEDLARRLGVIEGMP